MAIANIIERAHTLLMVFSTAARTTVSRMAVAEGRLRASRGSARRRICNVNIGLRPSRKRAFWGVAGRERQRHARAAPLSGWETARIQAGTTRRPQRREG